MSACESENEKLKYPVIESASVEIYSVEGSDVEVLHFSVEINDYGNEPEQEYNVRFVIQDTHISDLIAAEVIEIPETFKTVSVPKGGVHSINAADFREITEEYKIGEIKKYIENNKAVIVELYDGDRTITQEVITTFVDKREK